MFNKANNHSYRNLSSLVWRSTGPRASDYKYCTISNSGREMHVSSSTYYSTYVYCPHRFSTIITIHSMTFTGFNMHRHHPSVISMFAACQYGGLFVVRETGYLKLCANVRASFTFPFNGNRLGDGVIVFATFPGYSSGSLHLTSGKDYECTGLNIGISRGPSCNNYFTIWDDLGSGFHFEFNDWFQNNCTDLWIMNNLDYFDSSPFENCSFVLHPIHLSFLVGSVKMITGASALCTYSTPFLINSQPSALLEDMNVEVDAFKDAYDRTTTKVNFSVPLLTHNEYKFNSISALVFKVNFSFYDDFPAFAIRIKFQILSEIICTEK